jgi:hypothetical protein
VICTTYTYHFVVYLFVFKVAQTVVPVHLMRPGLRWVQLYDPDARTGLLTERFVLTRLLVLVGAQVVDSISISSIKGNSNGEVSGRVGSYSNGALPAPKEQYFPLKAPRIDGKPRVPSTKTSETSAAAPLKTTGSVRGLLPLQTCSNNDEEKSKHRSNSDPPPVLSSDPSRSSSFAEAVSAHQESYVNDHSHREFDYHSDNSDSSDSSDSSNTCSERSVNTIDAEDAQDGSGSCEGDGDDDSDDTGFGEDAPGSADSEMFVENSPIGMQWSKKKSKEF